MRKGKRGRRYVLAVVPGDCRFDFGRIRDLYGASDVSFAPLTVAEGLAGEIYFNAARAELSIAMAVPTYLALTSPRIADIAAAYAEGHP